jgi:hypothetical protein
LRHCEASARDTIEPDTKPDNKKLARENAVDAGARSLCDLID